jgi:hypothetical protein
LVGDKFGPFEKLGMSVSLLKKPFEVDYVVVLIKITGWWWFKVKFEDFDCDFNMWYHNPLLCLR